MVRAVLKKEHFRYGKIFRGNKVHNCQDRGGIGMIMFSDPAEVAPFGTDPSQLYPNTMFLPGSGVQRGSTFIGDGDPLSPDWPSVPNAYRFLFPHICVRLTDGTARIFFPLSLSLPEQVTFWSWLREHPPLRRNLDLNPRSLDY